MLKKSIYYGRLFSASQSSRFTSARVPLLPGLIYAFRFPVTHAFSEEPWLGSESWSFPSIIYMHESILPCVMKVTQLVATKFQSLTIFESLLIGVSDGPARANNADCPSESRLRLTTRRSYVTDDAQALHVQVVSQTQAN